MAVRRRLLAAAGALGLAWLPGVVHAEGPLDFVFIGAGQPPRGADSGPARAWKVAEFSGVRLAPREAGSTPNAQPAQVAAVALRAALSSIQTTARSSKEVPLFAASELDDLLPVLEEALAAAGPGEDLLLLSTSRRTDGPLTPPRSVLARLFVGDGRLQLIVQEARADLFLAFQAARVPPLLKFGSRQVDSGLLLRSAVAVSRRGDWLALDLDAATAAAPAKVGTTAPAPVNAPAGTPPRDRAFYEQQGLRLQELKRLREQGLLTEQEYEQKRRAIVDAL